MRDLRKQKGAEGETLACDFLISIGHKILKRNFRFSRCEIDIISSNGDSLHFIEVKYWREFKIFDPRLSLNQRKQHRMRMAAEGFLSQDLTFQNHFVSFDLVFINSKKGCEYYPQLF
ncbi:YraN family protein [Leptospira sp. 201903071]|uniref:YraN family protein n=1 Tax=Leptospira ainazelensis TaxID=2810034 RepID=UPI0019633605|nr:YraN family protein [Leptospira ainazelensis]MBM9498894.1 YraN family protein [Leptospira ainazelensis]